MVERFDRRFDKQQSSRRFAILHFGVVIASLLSPLGAVAATLPDKPPALPTDADQWINSGPLTYDNFRGKGVVLWYFEEMPALRREVAGNARNVAQYVR
jgi:hypothetical protein